MTDQKFILRAALLFQFKLNQTAAESHRKISDAFGEGVISERQCRNWFRRFTEGDESLADLEHGHRSLSLDLDLLKTSIESDPQQSTRELATKFGCSQKTIANSLHRIEKICRHGQWIPHQLSETNKRNRILLSSSLLSRSKSSGFLEALLTSDEKWIRYDNPRRKMQWLSKGERPTPTARAEIHIRKVMLCVWWNMFGLVHFEILNQGETVTAERYCQQLTRVHEALHRQGVETSNTKILHDNARPHVAKITHQKMEEFGWEVLPHPPYSPDLAPSDYCLFRSMQHFLGGKKFENNEEIKIWVTKYFSSQQPEFFMKGIRDLRTRWRTVIDNNGDYVID